MQTTPLSVTLQRHNWGVWLANNLLDRDNLSKEDKSLAPNVSIIQRFHCNDDSAWQAFVNINFLLRWRVEGRQSIRC